MIETRKYICDDCGSTFEANVNVVNPNCTVCAVVHVENPGFNPKMESTPAQSKEIVAVKATKVDMIDFYDNYENAYGGGD